MDSVIGPAFEKLGPVVKIPLALSFNLKNCSLWEIENMNCLQSFSMDNFSLWNYLKTINFLTKHIVLKQFITHAV